MVPVQIIVTIMLLRSSLRTAAAWVTGMAAVRLAQGILFGFVFSEVGAGSGASDGPGVVGSSLLLVFAVLFYVTAFRQALADDDADALPPRWMNKIESISGSAALGIGAAYVAVSPKFWVFTLGAIGAIADAQLGRSSAILTFAMYVALSLSTNLAVLTFGAVSPDASEAVLGRFVGWLEGNNRVITIVLGVVFGTWFLVKALMGFGVT